MTDTTNTQKLTVDDIPEGQPLTLVQFLTALEAGYGLPRAPWADEDDELCGAQHDDEVCDLDAGHEGPHSANLSVGWENAE